MASTPGRLSIGDFSRVSHLSVKTLRRYHESGLLEPAEVDQWSGYRYYRPAQIPAAQTIRRLRELDMPVREIAELLAAVDATSRNKLIAAHLARLEAQLEQTRSAVGSLRRLLDPDVIPLQVQRRAMPTTVTASIRETVAREDVLDWYSAAMTELDRVLTRSGHIPTGPPGGLYANDLYTDELGELVVYVPVADPPRSGRVQPLTLAATELAVAVHPGPHTDIDITYGLVGAWVNSHGLSVAGAVHETYLVGPRDTPDRAAWRTEIGWPIHEAS